MVREVEHAADGLWLIAHDPARGRPLIGRRVLGVGLAAALLAELVMGGFAMVAAGRIAPTDAQPHLRRTRHRSMGLTVLGWCSGSYQPIPPNGSTEDPCFWCGIRGAERFPDPLVWQTRQLIAQERAARPVGDWLTVLAPAVPDMVAERLAHGGWLTSEYRRRLIRGDVRVWTPASVVDADGPRTMLAHIARGRGRPDTQQALLAALVDALQLARVVLPGVADPQAARTLRAAAAGLDRPLRYLVEQAGLVADTAVVAHT